MAKLTRKQEDAVLVQYRAAIGEGVDHCEDKHSRWEENQKYTRGEQWSKADIERQERREKPAVPWNDVFKVVHAISNREMVSRMVPKVFGRNLADEGVANILDEACRWQRQYSESEHYESMGFRSASMCGYGVVHKYWDPVANDGDGMIRDQDVPLCEMLWPSRSREMNLADRRWHIHGRWVDVDLADEIWGGTDRRISKMLGNAKKKAQAEAGIADTSTLGQGEASPASAGWSWSYVRSGRFLNLAKREVFVGEFEWQEVEYRFRAAIPERFYEWVAFAEGGQPLSVESQDQQTGEPMEVPIPYEQFQQLPLDQQAVIRDAILAETEIQFFDDRSELNEFADLYEKVVGQEFDLYARVGKRVTKFAVVVNDKIAESGTRSYGWSYHFITGFPFETREGMDFFGVVDIVKGPQDYKNALISNMLSMYMSSPKGTLVLEESLVPNSNQFFDQLASPAGAVLVKDGFFSSQRHQFLQPPNFPPMLGPLLDLAGRGVENSLGISPVGIGAQDDLRRISGKVVQAADLAANVIVAVLFDSMRKFRRGYGLCNVRFLRHMYDSDELIRIVGDEKAPDVPPDPTQFDDILRFDISIDEQPSSPTEQMELLKELTVTGEMTAMRNRGDLTFEDQIKHFMPYMPQSVKREILKGRTMAEQKMQAEQQTQQAMMLVQELYQAMTALPGGQEALAGLVAEQQANGFSQQVFSQQGVPQAQPNAAPQ